MSNRSNWGLRHPRESVQLVRALLIAALCLFAFPMAVCAQQGANGAIRVASTGAEYAFSDSITFEIEIESAEPVDDLVLLFGRQGSRIVRRIYPEFSPSQEVTVIHIEDLEMGQFAPGTVIEYWWELSARADTLRTLTESFVYEDGRFDWQIVAGERVDLHGYGDNGDWGLNEEILDAADSAVNRLEEEIGIAVPERPQVYVYNTESDMALALTTRSEAYDDRILTLGVALDDHTLIVLGSHRDVKLTVAHELSHIVVGLATDNPYTPLPRWLDEGLAMYAEGELPRGNQRALEQAIGDDALLSIQTLTSYSGLADEVDLFYGEAYSIVEFMLDTYDREAMRDLLGQFAEGKRQEDALQTVLGFGLDELDLQWRTSLGLGARSSPDEIADSSSGTATTSKSGEEDIDLCAGPLAWLSAPMAGLLFAVGRRKKQTDA